MRQAELVSYSITCECRMWPHVCNDFLGSSPNSPPTGIKGRKPEPQALLPSTHSSSPGVWGPPTGRAPLGRHPSVSSHNAPLGSMCDPFPRAEDQDLGGAWHHLGRASRGLLLPVGNRGKSSRLLKSLLRTQNSREFL